MQSTYDSVRFKEGRDGSAIITELAPKVLVFYTELHQNTLLTTLFSRLRYLDYLLEVVVARW